MHPNRKITITFLHFVQFRLPVGGAEGDWIDITGGRGVIYNICNRIDFLLLEYIILDV